MDGRNCTTGNCSFVFCVVAAIIDYEVLVHTSWEIGNESHECAYNNCDSFGFWEEGEGKIDRIQIVGLIQNLMKWYFLLIPSP